MLAILSNTAFLDAVMSDRALLLTNLFYGGYNIGVYCRLSKWDTFISSEQSRSIMLAILSDTAFLDAVMSDRALLLTNLFYGG